MNWRIDPRSQPATAQNEQKASVDSFSDDEDVGERTAHTQNEYEWLRKAQDALLTSTSFIDTEKRKDWDDSLKAFNSSHSADSKYNNPAYDKRSKLFRPKTRTIERKNEAAAAAAFFSNQDVVDVSAQDANNKMEAAGAGVMKALLQYRLKKSVMWFHTVLGGLQDAQNTGCAAAHIYWEYKPAKPDLTITIADTPEQADEQDDEYPHQADLPKGAEAVGGDVATVDITVMPQEQPPQSPQYGLRDMQQAPMGAQQPQAPQPQQAQPKGPKPLVDKPTIDLVPIENLRFDPGADWTDPVNKSPYLIHLIPMYYMDIEAKMKDPESGWYTYSEGFVRASGGTTYDSTRTARQQTSDVYDGAGKTEGAYDICWVHRHIHRHNDEDWEFYTLNDQAMLSKPQKLVKGVLHGKRPYVIGNCVLETHKPYPNSLYMLGKQLQIEANEVANQRIDNVKLVLNKKYLVKRGRNVDVAGLVRNVPGAVVMADEPETDIKELVFPDVTASSYEEQQRIDNDMSDLLGNFSAAQVMADHGVNGPARNMAILGQSAGTLVEYTLRTFVETFVEPVLRQLMLLEQHYETDEVVLALAGKKAQVFQKFGVDEITDQLLEQELTLTVNVGMGATDPQLKTQKFIAAVSTFSQIAKEPASGLNLEEVAKELFGHLGYADGSRFFTNDNPEVAKLQAQLKQAMQMVQQLQQQVKEKMTGHQVKLQTSQMQEANKAQIAKNKEENENLRSAMVHRVTLVNADKARTHDLVLKNMEHRMSMVNHVRERAAMKAGDE